MKTHARANEKKSPTKQSSKVEGRTMEGRWKDGRLEGWKKERRRAKSRVEGRTQDTKDETIKNINDVIKKTKTKNIDHKYICIEWMLIMGVCLSCLNI